MRRHRWQRAVQSLIEVAPADSAVYHTFDNKNAYAPFGAIDIDDDPDGVDVIDAKDCQHRCTMDETCDCVTYKESKSKCWKRRECVVSQMTSPYNEGYTVFMKSEPRGSLLEGALGGSSSLGVAQPDPAAPAGPDPALPVAAAGPPVGQPVKGGYTVYKDLNAFEPFGCTDVTTNDDTTWGTEADCMAKCTADENCDCATYERATGGCWNRCNCVLADMTSGYNEGFNVYMKDGPTSTSCRASTASTTEHVDGAGYVPVKQYTSELLWHDDFDGDVLDESKWDIREGDPTVNDELQAYRKDGDNLVMTGSSAKISAKCEAFKGKSFTSVKLHSREMWKSGHRVEARIRMSTGPGTWPAFWLMGSGEDEWPAVGEIDILEYTGCANEVMGNLHFRNRHGDNPVNTYTATVAAEDWHTYRVDWVEDGMTFYLDDKVLGHVASSDSYSAWPYNTNEFFIIINLAIGGTLGGPCLSDAVRPSCEEFLEIDWVRVSMLK